MANDATLEILIQIREQLAGLTKTRDGLQGAKKDAEGLGSILKQGLGIGSGMQLAVSAIGLLKSGMQATFGEAVRLSGEIKDQSEALGLTARAYQVLRIELMSAGVDAGRLSMAVSTQTQSLADARDIASSAATAYRTLGLDLGKIEQLPIEKRLELIARATLNAKDSTLAFQAAGQILGSRDLPQLLNALHGVATEGYDKVAAAADATGRIIDEHTAETIDKAKKQWEDYKNWAVVQSASLINALLDPLSNTPSAIVERERQRRIAEAAAANMPRNVSPLPLAQTTEYQQTQLALLQAQGRAEIIQADTLTDEVTNRLKISGALKDQIGLQQKLLDMALSTPLTPSENQVDRDRLIIQLRTQIAVLQKNQVGAQLGPEPTIFKIEREFKDINNPDSPDFLTKIQGAKVGMEQFLVTLGSDGKQIATVLNSSLGSALSSVSDSIYEGFKGTESWRDAFRSLADIAGRALSQIIAQMFVIQAINAVLGIFGYGTSGGTISKVDKVVSGGGGQFLTRGPTNFTVGDNPGGVELVSVIPISGVGQTSVNGRAMKMAGGGSALVAGAGAGMGGDTFNFSYAFQGGVTRQEVLAMLPGMVDASKSAVLEAKKRRRGGF